MEWIRNRRPSPALVISLIALAVALAGTAGALPGRNSVKSNDIAPKSVHARHLGGTVLHVTPLIDRDSTAGDGVWTTSTDSAVCRSGRLLSGGVRTGQFPPPSAAAVTQTEPRPGNRQWVGSVSTDTGGTARFSVVAYCLKR
jgi:hypothetical protein